MVDLDDSLALGAKLARWNAVSRAFFWLWMLGFLGFCGITWAAFVERVPALVLGYYTLAWLPIGLVWAMAHTKADRFEDRLAKAEFREKFDAISRKYDERLKNVGRKKVVPGE